MKFYETLLKHYDNNKEWNFFAYKYEEKELIDVVANASYSTIVVKFAFQRNSPYYTLTLIIPIITLTLLAPIGLIIPGIFQTTFCIFQVYSVESGGKLGFSMTLLLTVFIYIDYLQNNIPVFDSIGKTPNLLTYFVAVILLVTLALLGKILE